MSGQQLAEVPTTPVCVALTLRDLSLVLTALHMLDQRPHTATSGLHEPIVELCHWLNASVASVA